MFLIETVPLIETTPASTSTHIAVKRIENSGAGVLRGHGRKNAKKMHGYIQRRYEQDKAGEKLAIQASKKPVCERQATDLLRLAERTCSA